MTLKYMVFIYCNVFVCFRWWELYV